MNKNINNGVIDLKERIKSESALYFYRSTPFSEHGEFNYNGALTENFFFKNLFSNEGECTTYLNKIAKALNNRSHKSIILIGNQGCGKSTFVHYLKKEFSEADFKFFDFDKNTSNPTLSEYIEIFSNYLLSLLKKSNEVNKQFYNLYITNEHLICEKINGNNNISTFFKNFHTIFILKQSNEDDFIKFINSLYFNQILSLIILWHVCCVVYKKRIDIKPIVFCLDNLDVLVNQEIIEKFFKEYLLFVRNVDSIIQNLHIEFLEKNKICYNSIFTFVFCCRQHTWARVRQHYRHDNPFIRISTLELNITDVFDKKKILEQRERYIHEHQDYYGAQFEKEVSDIKLILSDMDSDDEKSHNIYDLFDDDYRQCTITFEELINDNPQLIEQYLSVKKSSYGKGHSGARGIVYKALFEKFKEEGLFNQIGVLALDSEAPLVSNARMILNYLNYHTYEATLTAVSFNNIARDFNGIIEKGDIEQSLIAMFNLGDNSSWNELIAFKEIHTEQVTSCESTEIFITKAGHEYLNFIATHFEFYNIRVVKRRKTYYALFSPQSCQKSSKNEYEYNFQETITDVCEIVDQCCKNMSDYYNQYMRNRFPDIEKYMKSHFVYGDANVLHGERIIHTHIRYIDNYRLYLLNSKNSNIDKEEVNKYLVEFIEEYIQIGEKYSVILTRVSTDKLFPAFKTKIEQIKNSGYKDFTTRIDIDPVPKS